jgi:hypothetical protein
MTANIAANACPARSTDGRITQGPPAGGDGWYCSLEEGHQGDHEAYDLNDQRPSRFIARWTR